MHTEVRVKKGEVIDRALRRLKKKLDKEGTLKELRNRRHYEKPSEIKRRLRKNLQLFIIIYPVPMNFANCRE